MKALAKSAALAPALVVALTRSPSGLPCPALFVRFPRGTHYRVIRAALLRAASEIELATPTGEGWIVIVEADRVALELLSGSEAEADRGMAFLRTFVP